MRLLYPDSCTKVNNISNFRCFLLKNIELVLGVCQLTNVPRQKILELSGKVSKWNEI